MAERLDGIVLREMRVRLIWDAAERASWDGLMEAHHYLEFRSPFGASLRHVAELSSGEWAVLVADRPGRSRTGGGSAGWVAAGAAIPAAAPDSQQHTVSGFAGLPGSELGVACFEPVGAAPVVGHGGAVGTSGFLAETFVDPVLFAGTCHRAAGWTEIGETRGFGRDAGG